MDRKELQARLQSIEWSDIEFKEASWQVPKNALSTVSAFANTEGGHLVFGVKEANGTFTVTGVTDPDKVQNDFFGQVRDNKKVSVFLPIDGDDFGVGIRSKNDSSNSHAATHTQGACFPGLFIFPHHDEFFFTVRHH